MTLTVRILDQDCPPAPSQCSLGSDPPEGLAGCPGDLSPGLMPPAAGTLGAARWPLTGLAWVGLQAILHSPGSFSELLGWGPSFLVHDSRQVVWGIVAFRNRVCSCAPSGSGPLKSM